MNRKASPITVVFCFTVFNSFYLGNPKLGDPKKVGVYNNLGHPNFPKVYFFITQVDSQNMAGMDALSESAEMMIKNINQLAADEKRVRTSDLANKTELKPATVTEMIQRLGDLGLVDYEPYHGVHLTKQGQHVADVIEHRFNILERFLTEILGVDNDEASEVACRMEHVLTRDVEHKLTTFLGVDPQKESELFCHKINIEDGNDHKYLPLSNFKEGKKGTVKLIFENNELAKILGTKGIIPGSSLLLKESNNKVYTIQNDEGEFSVDRDTASKIILKN